MLHSIIQIIIKQRNFRKSLQRIDKLENTSYDYEKIKVRRMKK